MLLYKLISPHCERCSVRRYFMGGHSRHPFQCNEKKSNAWQHPPSIMKDLRGQCNVSDKERHENLLVDSNTSCSVTKLVNLICIDDKCICSVPIVI